MSGRRTWRHQFADAFRGMWLAVRRDRSFRIHLLAALAVVVVAALLRCDPVEWCLLVGCIGAVFAVETVNSSIETLFHALDDATKARMTGCLDRAAGAVLIASITAVVIGVLILGRRAATAFGWM